MSGLTHFDAEGRAVMVDVSDKAVTSRLATAEARLVGPDGTLYAHATTTCLVFDLPAS